VKEFVGIQRVVAEKLIDVAVQLPGAGFQNCVDVASAVAPLAGVVKRSLHPEFLDNIRVRQRHVIVLCDVVVGRADAFDQVVVIVFALPVYVDLRGTASELRGLVQFALHAGAERKELLVILRRQRQISNRFRSDRLSRGGVGRLDGSNLRRNLNFFGDCAGFQRDAEPRGFRDAHFDIDGFCFSKTRLVHHHIVFRGRQQGSFKRAIRARGQAPHQPIRCTVDDLDVGSGDCPAVHIHHCPADGPGGAALSKSRFPPNRP
jgi:hypothetical protein